MAIPQPESASLWSWPVTSDVEKLFSNLTHMLITCAKFHWNRSAKLASCLINVQPLPAHRPAADDNSLTGCTGHDLTDDWLLASTHLVDSLCPFGECLGAFFYWTRCFENNVPFNNTTPIYLINLLWKLAVTRNRWMDNARTMHGQMARPKTSSRHLLLAVEAKIQTQGSHSNDSSKFQDFSAP